MDYNSFAKTYSETRSPLKCISDFLLDEFRKLGSHAVIIEIGCGTGNYIIELSKALPMNIYRGFDLSGEMLKIAMARNSNIEFILANAEIKFPYMDGMADAAFMVDVIHHIVDYETFFSECSRVLKPKGILMIVTDSERDIYSRSGTKYFPETLKVELERYPTIDELNKCAWYSHFVLARNNHIERLFEIDDALILSLEKKKSSSLRLITEEEFQSGIERVKKAKCEGEKWLSSYTILKYQKI